MRGSSRPLQQKIIAKKRKKLIVIFSVLVFSTLILLPIFYFASRAEWMSVDTILVENQKGRISESAIKEAVQNELTHEGFELFSSQNTFVLNTGKLEEKLITLFPLTKTISISRSGLTGLTIEITEKTARLNYCDKATACFDVDEEGFIFAPQASSSAKLLTITGLYEKAPLGDFVLKTDEVKSLLFFIQQIGKIGFKTTIINLDTDNVSLTLEDGGKIHLRRTQDLAKALSLLEALTKDTNLNITESQFLKNLDYIDMRYGNKIAYKLKK